MNFKHFVLTAVAAIAIFFVPLTPAQTVSQSVSNLYTAGLSYNASADQKFAGTAMYSHQLNNAGTYAFTLIDALPGANKTVTTNIGIGVAQKVATIAGHDVFAPTSAGISFSGVATGWAYTGGLAVPVQYKSTGWYVMPSVRFLKSSISGAGYQVIPGVQFGFGK